MNDLFEKYKEKTQILEKENLKQKKIKLKIEILESQIKFSKNMIKLSISKLAECKIQKIQVTEEVMLGKDEIIDRIDSLDSKKAFLTGKIRISKNRLDTLREQRIHEIKNGFKELRNISGELSISEEDTRE